MGWERYSSTDPYKPICWAVYPGFLIPPLMGEGLSPEVGKKSIPKIGQLPNTKSVSIDTSGNGVNLPDCTDLCNRLKIERNPITTLCGQ